MSFDPSSLSNADAVSATHIHVDWNVDFGAKALTGVATFNAVVHKDGTTEMVFDATPALAAGIDTAAVTADGAAAAVSVGAPRGALGVPVSVALPAGKQSAGSEVIIAIPYSVSSTSTALQFLDPPQTAGKTHPYLFTQCQAIHARSLLPCQDGPGMKSTYSAKVTVPAPLTALMSALREGEPVEADGKRTFSFNQPVAVSSYLIALAVGELAGRDVGPRTTVWSEPSMVDSVAHEFADTERFIAEGEKLLTPYVWTRYDVLCLPPSFPYGGMENPTLTFVTPTLLAGDRSLADVICHEIAHSWTGNLVTTKTWEHFWLNEGCTMWVQRKIMSAIHGPAFFDFDATIGLKALNDSIEHFGADNPLTCLVPDLSGDIDPDDSFSSVPYEKGFFFLYHLEKTVGGPAQFDPFFRKYIETYSHGLVTTEEFRKLFEDHFAAAGIDVSGVDWDKWMKTPGYLPDAPVLDDSLRRPINELAEQWFKDPAAVGDAYASFNAGQRIAFLDQMLINQESAAITPETLARMDSLYGMSESKNSEIMFRWQKLNLRAGVESIVPAVVAFVTSQGRMKFTRPLYRELFKTSFGKDTAIATFRGAEATYHPITAKMVRTDLGL